VLYLVIYPFYPLIDYKVQARLSGNDKVNFQDSDVIKKKTEEKIALNNEIKYISSEPTNWLIINKINVDIPIIISNGAWALDKGAWILPIASTPDKGGNTIITGHRFKYLPPSNTTFYLLNKLAVNDLISVLWQNKVYYYKVREIKIVNDDDASVNTPSKEPILTLYTCDPIFSTKHRLVVISDLMQ
jgi:sortase A